MLISRTATRAAAWCVVACVALPAPAAADPPALSDAALEAAAEAQASAETSSETIEIRGEAPPTTAGAEKLDRNELQRIPGTGGDVVRALTAMPGVVNLQIPLGFTGVVIRGASPQDSKVMIDGFEVPLLFHNIAFRSVLPAESIDSLDYLPGGFDVAYGRASSGIIDLTTRPGSAARSEQAELSVIDGGLLAQGSAGAHTRYMLGVRRSLIDLLLPAFIPSDADLSLTTVPRYYDAQLRIDHDFSPAWRLMISALASDDLLSITASRDPDAAAKTFFNHTRFARATASAQYHDGPWAGSLALSAMLPQLEARQGLYQFVRFTYPMVTPRGEISHASPSLAGLSDVVWKAGAELQVTRADADVALGTEPREGEPPPAQDPRDVSTTFKGVVWLPDAAAWTSLAGGVDRVRATLGVRADYFGRAGELAVQPRGELQVKLPAALTARLSSGLYTRPPEYQSEILTKGLQAERSVQTIAGLQYEPREGLRVQGSLYYTDRSHLIVHASPTTTALVNDGRGATAGAELLATYRSAAWFTWLSYSYSHSTRVDHPGGPRRLFDFDQPHSLNAAASWRHGRWQLGGRFQLYSGLPYTPATGSLLDSDRNFYTPTYGAVNSARAPIHHQLDVRVDYAWQWGPAAMTAYLDIQNVYMNESVVTYFYNYDYSQRAAFKSIPILPSLGLRGVL
ncbi:MAG TPA: TonB-dependent receptor plug domain-containing protein [Kofleriaceae bacterium]|nr:TonB-dependent receptor plug domain-containing protein [Kofleriaceae bacterium]